MGRGRERLQAQLIWFELTNADMMVNNNSNKRKSFLHRPKSKLSDNKIQSTSWKASLCDFCHIWVSLPIHPKDNLFTTAYGAGNIHLCQDFHVPRSLNVYRISGGWHTVTAQTTRTRTFVSFAAVRIENANSWVIATLAVAANALEVAFARELLATRWVDRAIGISALLSLGEEVFEAGEARITVAIGRAVWVLLARAIFAFPRKTAQTRYASIFGSAPVAEKYVPLACLRFFWAVDDFGSLSRTSTSSLARNAYRVRANLVQTPVWNAIPVNLATAPVLDIPSLGYSSEKMQEKDK